MEELAEEPSLKLQEQMEEIQPESYPEANPESIPKANPESREEIEKIPEQNLKAWEEILELESEPNIKTWEEPELVDEAKKVKSESNTEPFETEMDIRSEPKSEIESKLLNAVEELQSGSKIEQLESEQKSLQEVEEPRLEPLEDWTYLKIRDLLSQLNNALYLYSNKLTKDIIEGKMFQTRFLECHTKYSRLFSECKGIIQDKIKFQEQLDDLRNKYSAMEQVLAKVKDINEDNRQMIEKLRGNRDQCLRADSEKTKTIGTLRNQAAELRRKLNHFRLSYPDFRQ